MTNQHVLLLFSNLYYKEKLWKEFKNLMKYISEKKVADFTFKTIFNLQINFRNTYIHCVIRFLNLLWNLTRVVFILILWGRSY